MIETALKRSLLTLSAIALITATVSILRRIKAMAEIIDPLKNVLPEKEVLLYRYLVTLEVLSTYGRTAPQNDTAESVRKYIKDNPVAQCRGTLMVPGCGRWFLAEVSYCPYCHIQTTEIEVTELERQVADWEHFRTRLSETSHIRGITRITAVKLHYYLKHPGEG